MTGSDFLDSLMAAYTRASNELRSKLAISTFMGLQALSAGEKPNYSVLSDHLYSLKANAEQMQKTGQPSLLSDIVTNTPLITKLRDSITSSEGSRARNLLASLSTFKQASLARPKKLVRRKPDKGKHAANDSFGHGAFAGEMHVHRMSLISQVQDLFPDLGSGYVVKLLDEYGDDVEQVTAHLLDDSLPPHLTSADKSEQIPPSAAELAPQQSNPDYAPDLQPRSTPSFERRNIFDNDELDNLAVDTSRLHIGRRNANLTADQVLADRSTAPNKAHILAALAAFDSDDDERDDTYDIEDVGGTVDTARPGASDDVDADLRDGNEEALFRAYKMNPEAFGRSAEIRRGGERRALKAETRMTDEAIEGWAIMMARDPRKMRRLEAKLESFGGQQRELQRTSYRASPAGSGGEDSEDAGTSGGERGGFRGRGRGGGRGGFRGRGGRGGGGDVAGPASERDTLQARQRKEASKGSRANHNRRDQRARKMARGGFPG